MPHKIFLLGAYGQDNIGDEAILEVFLEELSNYQCLVASSNPEKTENTYNVPVVGTYRDYRKMLAFLLNSDVIIFGGGSLLKELNPRVTGRREHSLLSPLFIGVFLAKLLRKKVVFSAIGVGPLKGSISKVIARLALIFANLVTVRDESSRILLSRLGFKHGILAADPALLLTASEEKAEKKRAQNHLRVGMCPVYFFNGENSWVSLVKIFAKFVDYLIENYNAEVFLIPFQSGYTITNDLELNKHIFREIKRKSQVNLLSDITRPKKTLETIRSLDFVVGVRLHSLIFSFLAKKPFLAMVYDEKVRNFLGDISLKRYSVEVRDLDTKKLQVRFEEVFKDKQKIVRHLEEILPIMVNRARLNFRCLTQILESKAS